MKKKYIYMKRVKIWNTEKKTVMTKTNKVVLVVVVVIVANHCIISFHTIIQEIQRKQRNEWI